jgi:hypothetical protein
MEDPFEDAAFPYNISMGYPLERTALAGLLASIFEAQEGRVDGKYYAPHYLAVLRHPYIKSLRLLSPSTSNHQITEFSATDTHRHTQTTRSTSQPVTHFVPQVRGPFS